MARYDTSASLDALHVIEGDRAFARMNSRTRRNLLPEGEVVRSINGRMDTDGAWQPRLGLQAISPALAVSTAALTLPFFAYADLVADSIARSGDTVTLTFDNGHDFVADTIVSVSGLTATPDPNGNRIVTAITSTTIAFDVPGLTGTPTGTATVGAPILADTVANAIYGSCVFSSPNETRGEYIIIATNNKAVAVLLADGTSTDIAYPGSELVDARCELLQAFSEVFLLRPGQTPLRWNGALTGSPAFVKVASGTYSQPVSLTDANATISPAGLVSIDNAAPHLLQTGDEVTILDFAANTDLEGRRVRVTRVDANKFTFLVNAPAETASPMTVRRSVSLGGGFSHMPAPPWATYFQRRLISPYWYEVGTIADTYTDREVRDELIVSDILDSDTWDTIYAQFRITAGIADEIVAVEPFTEGTLIIFNRNSIHLVVNAGGALADMQVRELTTEIGCIARKSIQRIGSQVLFLSDNGIYAIGFADEYNLRGIELPLSEPIQDQFARLTAASAGLAVSAYYDNRYYIALPIDGSVSPNALFVYNFLNKGWESIDQVNDPLWIYQDLHVARVGQLNAGFVVNSLGGVHRLESPARTDGTDRINVVPGQIQPTVAYTAGEVTTRQYSLGSVERTRITRFEAQVGAGPVGAVDAEFSAVLQNPDKERVLRTISDYNSGLLLGSGETLGIRGSVRERCYGVQLRVIAKLGRPKIKNLQVEGHISDRQTASVG
jgi:hypothetical protein